MNLPASNTIPDKLINASIYLKGNEELIGTADIELPPLEYVVEELKSLGIAGSIETPTIGHFKAMPLKLKWNIINKQAIILMNCEAHHLDIRASMQSYDAGSGELIAKPLKLIVRALPKKVSLGKMEAAKKSDNDAEFECVYLKMWIAGELMLEIDKLNFIANISGKDHLAEIRTHLGK